MDGSDWRHRAAAVAARRHLRQCSGGGRIPEPQHLACTGAGHRRIRRAAAGQAANIANIAAHTAPCLAAYRDADFLLRDELRPVRFQLELLKTEMLLDEAGIGSTLVCYGSARIPAPEETEALVAKAA